MTPITSFSQAERLFDCTGRAEILLSETSPDGLEVWSAWRGPDGPSTRSAPSWKKGYGYASTPAPRKHQTREAETAKNTAIIQIWPLIYSIHPNKPHAALQETNTRSKNEDTRTCSCCASPYHQKMLSFMPKWKAEGMKSVSDGVVECCEVLLCFWSGCCIPGLWGKTWIICDWIQALIIALQNPVSSSTAEKPRALKPSTN